jgi:hypothetical protein
MSAKLIAKYKRCIEEWEVKILQKQRDQGFILKQLSPTENWSTRVKNGTLRLQIEKLQKDIYQLQTSIDMMQQRLRKEEETKRQFDLFLQPIIEAGFLVYDNGKNAYTAQQLRNLKEFNEVSVGCCLVNPKMFEKAEIYFASKGYNLNSGDLPGDLSLLSEKYKNYISKMYTCLHSSFLDKSRNFDLKVGNQIVFSIV